MNLNTLYNATFCRNVDDAGVETYEPVLKSRGRGTCITSW